nr:immunoglobulin heavy chain junction region [Homo sapiens]
QTRPCITVRET